MVNELFDFGIEWGKDPGDCTPCAVCGDPIYGNKYTCKIEIEGNSQELDAVLCESCYSEKFP